MPRHDDAGHEPADRADEGAPAVAHHVAGDHAIGIAGDAEIGDLAEAQDAAISPQDAQAESDRNIEEVVGGIAGLEFARHGGIGRTAPKPVRAKPIQNAAELPISSVPVMSESVRSIAQTIRARWSCQRWKAAEMPSGMSLMMTRAANSKRDVSEERPEARIRPVSAPVTTACWSQARRR